MTCWQTYKTDKHSSINYDDDDDGDDDDKSFQTFRNARRTQINTTV